MTKSSAYFVGNSRPLDFFEFMGFGCSFLDAPDDSELLSMFCYLQIGLGVAKDGQAPILTAEINSQSQLLIVGQGRRDSFLKLEEANVTF